MAIIGEYRLKAYELLFSKPICEYASKSGATRSQNVLIIGSGWMGTELFKAAFWAGQATGYDLTLTIASRNAEAFQNTMLGGGEHALFPALPLFAEHKHYAELRFIPIDVESSLEDSGLAPLHFESTPYNYVAIALGDAEHNWLAASNIVSQLASARENADGNTGKAIVNVFTEFSDSVSEEDRNTLISQGQDFGIEVHFFGEESAESNCELQRMARNLNFAYEMKYDERIKKSAADARFEESLEKEFVLAPHDYEVEDTMIASNFIGSSYAADSSLASVVHIPVKLRICKNAFPDVDPMETLKEAICKKNSIYKKLVAIEHRRWNAYTVMRGYRAPTETEEESLLFQNGNTNQDKQKLLHICLCDGSERMTLAEGFDQSYQNWLAKNCPKTFPSELDRASLRAHQIASKLSSKTDMRSVLSKISGNCVEYVNLKAAIAKLTNDEQYSLNLYQNALEDALMYAATVSKEEEQKILEADRILLPVKARNARTDYFGLDRQLVDMLPFVMWYEKLYDTVITFTDGINDPVSDVIVPTLFCAKTAFFVGKRMDEQAYQEIISRYFAQRGGNTQPVFLSISSMDVETVARVVEQRIAQFGLDRLVVNTAINGGVDSLLAFGQLMEQYDRKLNVVQYLPGKGVVSFSADKYLGAGLNNKSLSLSEYINLLGGKFENELANHYDHTQYQQLYEIYGKYCLIRRIHSETEPPIQFHPWGVMTQLFSDVSKDIIFESEKKIKAASADAVRYHGRFRRKMFENCAVGKTLTNLQKYRIIRNYTETGAGEYILAEFECVNPEICEILRPFEVGGADRSSAYKSLKFSPVNGGLKLANWAVKEATLFSEDDPKEIVQIKTEFMRDLEKAGFVRELSIEKTGIMSFVFRDEATMVLLKKQGTVFELIVYYLLRSSGMFDDVETGVSIAWDDNEMSQEELLEKRLEESDDFGYPAYLRQRNRVIYTEGSAVPLKNEIDVVAVKGMNVYMVSCKTSDKLNMQWIYEIRSISNQFSSTGILAWSSIMRDKNGAVFKKRSHLMGIPFWDTEVLWNSEQFKGTLKYLLS